MALRACASTYRKPTQRWAADEDADMASEYSKFASKKQKSISPMREYFFNLMCAIVVVGSIFPDSAAEALGSCAAG